MSVSLDHDQVAVAIYSAPTILRHLLATELSKNPKFKLLFATTDAAELIDFALAGRAQVIVAISGPGEPDLHTLLRGLSAWSVKRTGVLVIDDQLQLANLRDAARLGAVAYYPKTESFHSVLAGIEKVAKGEYSFPPSLAQYISIEGGKCHVRVSQPGNSLSKLSPRELEVLIGIARGLTVRQCAASLGLSESTVDNQKSSLMKKLEVHRSTELVHIAIREGLLAPKHAG